MSTPAERSILASIAANERWSRVPDRAAAMANATRNSPASMEYWLTKVDPGQKMSRPDRGKAARNAKAAHYKRLTLRMRKAKRRGEA
jgi:hypothetical protein